MPAQPPKDPDAILALQDWIRLLTEHGAPVRGAMTLAGQVYRDYNTRTKLALLTETQVREILPEKEMHKGVWNAIKGVSGGQTPQKRSRHNDPLRLRQDDARDIPESFTFDEILDPEALLAVSVTVNRAPIKTGWAYAVARRLGFDVEEALSLAHVYVHIGSLKHALALGNILNAQETRDAEDEIRELPGESGYHVPGKRKERDEEEKVGSSQPWVGLLRAKPVIERPDGKWRAIQKGVPVEPSAAYLYITRALKDSTPHVMGAMQLVTESYSPEELEAVGLELYNNFKPDVQKWGQRGSVEVAKILEQIKAPLEDEEEAKADEDGAKVEEVGESKDEEVAASETISIPLESPAKKAKTDAKDLSVEEYEAMLDAEYDEALYQF